MSGVLLLSIVISILIALIASTLAVFLKLIFFLRQKDSYRHILKFGLYGEITGFLLILVAWCFYSAAIKKLAEPEGIFAIPFFLMMLGLITGTIINYIDKRKIKANDRH